MPIDTTSSKALARKIRLVRDERTLMSRRG
jgi:hypothetical protein